jgi:hypothetical protein
MTGLLEQLRERHADRQQADAAAFRQLVLVAADGDAEADEIDEFLRQHGIDLDSFTAAVQRITSRRDAAAKLAGIDEARREAAAASEHSRAVEQERDAVMHRINAQLRSAKRAEAEAVLLLRDCEQAKSVLMSTADPALIARRNDLLRIREQAEADVDRLRKAITAAERIDPAADAVHDVQRQVGVEITQSGRPTMAFLGRAEVKVVEERAAELRVAHDRRLTAMRQELATAEQAYSAAARDLAGVTAAMLMAE